MATKPKPKPKMLPYTGMPGVAMQPAKPKAVPKPAPVVAAAHTPTLQEIADAFGGANNAVAFSRAQAMFPEGSYDPQLDAQGDNQNQGSLWQTQDYETANQRALDDYNQAVSQLNQSHGYNLSDLQTAQDRDLADFTTRTTDLGTQYQRLGTGQTQNANAAGVGGGGALVAAAAARAANQGADQSKLQSAYDRQIADISQSRDRENTAYTTGLSGLDLSTSRGGEDRDTAQHRQLYSNSLFNQQLLDQKGYQAQQSDSWLPDVLSTAPKPAPAATTPKAPNYAAAIRAAKPVKIVTTHKGVPVAKHKSVW